MTAIRNTILAFGLMLLTLAASASRADDSSGYATASDASCEAGCQGGACQNGNGASFGGFRPQDFCHEPGCRYANNPCNLESDPVFSEFSPEYRDLCERCGSCCWRANASAMYLQRSRPSSATLLVDSTGTTNLLNAADMDFPYRVGPRLSFTVVDCAGWGLELNYFGVDGWSATRDFTSADFTNGFANLVVDSVIQSAVTDAHIDFTSTLYSSEINVRKTICGGIDAICGFRWIDMNDRYYSQGTSLVTTNQVTEAIHTHNNLFGCQTGLDGSIGSRDSKFRLGGFIKAGGMLNNATASTSLSDPGNLGSLSASDTVCHCAFFGEAGLTGYIQIDKHVSISGGYQVMYISDVAQPVNQMAQTSLIAGTTLIDVGSDIFYHGANLGLEVSW